MIRRLLWWFFADEIAASVKRRLAQTEHTCKAVRFRRYELLALRSRMTIIGESALLPETRGRTLGNGYCIDFRTNMAWRTR